MDGEIQFHSILIIQRLCFWQFSLQTIPPTSRLLLTLANSWWTATNHHLDVWRLNLITAKGYGCWNRAQSILSMGRPKCLSCWASFHFARSWRLGRVTWRTPSSIWSWSLSALFGARTSTLAIHGTISFTAWDSCERTVTVCIFLKGLFSSYFRTLIMEKRGQFPNGLCWLVIESESLFKFVYHPINPIIWLRTWICYSREDCALSHWLGGTFAASCGSWTQKRPKW